MKLLDVNILVYSHRGDAERHEEFKIWLETAMESEEALAVSELVLSSCLRILTHRKIFDPPTPLSTAIEYIQQLKGHPNMTLLAPGRNHWEIFLRLCREGAARGNLVSDAYHAALAIEYGCEWISMDRDFARFPGLRWRTPFDQ